MKMIKSYNRFLAIFLLMAIITWVSCSSPEPTIVEKNTSLLTSSPWKIKTLSVDDVDFTNSVKNLTITFTSGKYTTANGAVIWPASGTWKFTDNNATTFTRDDGTIISITDLTSTTLTLTFVWAKTTFQGGRAESASGKNVFKLIR